MEFVSWRGLSEGYRRAVEGHSPWDANVKDPEPIRIDDVDVADLPPTLRATVKAEGIGALAFIPIVTDRRLVGKFMMYRSAPHVFGSDEVSLALNIARQLGFSLERMRIERARRGAEEALRESEQRLNLALRLRSHGRMGVGYPLRRRELVAQPRAHSRTPARHVRGDVRGVQTRHPSRRYSVGDRQDR